MRFLTWCPGCGDDLEDVLWKRCPVCEDEVCLDCYQDHMDEEHDVLVGVPQEGDDE